MSCPCPRAVSIWRIWEFTKAGAEPGLLKPGLCSESFTQPCHSLLSKPLVHLAFHLCLLSHASMIFSPFTFHSLTAKANPSRLWWHTGYSFCWVLQNPRGASQVPSLHNNSAWPVQGAGKLTGLCEVQNQQAGVLAPAVTQQCVLGTRKSGNSGNE